MTNKIKIKMPTNKNKITNNYLIYFHRLKNYIFINCSVLTPGPTYGFVIMFGNV